MDGVPHHMIAVTEPGEQWSAARYTEMAVPIIDDILARGKLPILVGGTGLWLDAVVQGRTFAGGHAGGDVRKELQQRLEQEGIEPLIAQLRQVDPAAAERLHPSDEKRILRALEVYLETGETITEHNRRTQAIPPKYNPVWFALEDTQRSRLYERIDRRVDEMLRQGLVEEIRDLLASGIPPKATAMQAIGYKEFVAALQGHITVAEAADQVRQSSRHYAKRQLTWFRRNSAIHWLRREENMGTEEILRMARQVLHETDN